MPDIEKKRAAMLIATKEQHEAVKIIEQLPFVSLVMAITNAFDVLAIVEGETDQELLKNLEDIKGLGYKVTVTLFEVWQKEK